MRLAVITNLYPPDVLGGYELLAHDVVQWLRGRGHEVRVLTSGRGGEDDGVYRTLRLARPFDQKPRSDRLRHVHAYAANRLATRRFSVGVGRPDAALVMSLRRVGLGAVRALARAGVPLVVTVNDDWPVFYRDRPLVGLGDAPKWALDRVLAPVRSLRGLPVARAVYLSDAVRESVLTAGVALPRGRVLPQGVDLGVFEPRPHRPMRPSPVLLSVGRLHPTKAPEVALDALAALVARGVAARLVLAGTAHEQAYERSLRARADRLGVAGHVEWLGHVPRERLPQLYREADMLVFATTLEHEGQGLTYLEAVACGLPVVAYPTGGAREFLDRHPAVVRVDALDGEAFAAAICALAADPERQRALVDAGLEVVRDHGSLDAYVAALEAELEAVSRRSG